ncbi:ROK family protein [Tumebacillus permanentifrigoris]|uniref:Glucokinase n=1 Tax=Tumebacillus permanentifrigoris TaxID=378543 RepID=A0A316DFB1_9BACL|nr:ROK family protein [Tumebacillus permanentifrigoris]PWK16406.1 glucokinase [Tumebacillus permanentifrigoris]
MKPYVIGVDIGGTKIAIGLVDEAGRVIGQHVLPTHLDNSPSVMVQQIAERIDDLLLAAEVTLEQVRGIGVGAPGPLDVKKGVFLCPPNLPTWHNYPLLEDLQSRYSVPVLIENDANAATLAEKWVGAARTNDHFIYLTISTGIGAGLYLNGNLISSIRENAGEVGHIVIDPARGRCICGQLGCLEWIASGTAIARRGSELLGRIVSTEEVFSLYRSGHPKLVALVEETFTYIGMGCVTLINLFSPERIIIGGGVSNVGNALFEAVRSYVQGCALNPSGRTTAIVPSEVGAWAGVVGAAAVVWQRGEDVRDASVSR